MQIRLRNVLATGALTSGLIAGGALVANAATTSTTTRGSGNTGTSSTSNSSTANSSTTTPSSSSSAGNTGSGSSNSSTGSTKNLPRHGPRLELERPAGNAPVVGRPPTSASGSASPGLETESSPERSQRPHHRGTGGVGRIAESSGPHRPLSEFEPTGQAPRITPSPPWHRARTRPVPRAHHRRAPPPRRARGGAGGTPTTRSRPGRDTRRRSR